MDRLNSMRVFVKVGDSRSFARTADLLDLSVGSVSRMIADLERHLGTRLLQRTTRTTSLTETGELYLEQCRRILNELDNAESLVSEQALATSGNLRLVAPTLFALRKLPPVLAQFQQMHPRVKLDLVVADRTIDLVDEALDLAILPARRVTGMSLVSRHLTGTEFYLCGSPSYISQHGAPHHPLELSEHRCLTFHTDRGDSEMLFYAQDGQQVHVHPNICFSTNNIGAVREGALAGMGVAALPGYLVDDDLRSGTLRRLMPEYRLPDREFRIAYASRKFLSLKVRSFIELAVTHFQIGSQLT